MKDKNIIRVEKNRDFVTIKRTVLNDKRLSWKAKGIMAYMLTMPDDWVFYLDEIRTHSTDGETSFRNGFNELKQFGYVGRNRDRLDDGTFEWRTIVHEEPHGENHSVDNHLVENHSVDNHVLLSTEEPSIDKLNIDKLKNHIVTIFNYWNEKEITIHRELTQARRSKVNARLEKYSLEEIKKAIDNYTEVLTNDKYYYSHKFKLERFMDPAILDNFLDENEPFENYKNFDGKDEPRKVAEYDPKVDAF